LANQTEIERFLCLLHCAGNVVEIRALKVSTPDYRRAHTVSGYFDDFARAAAAAAELSQHAGAVYCTLNEIDPALLARAHNRVRPVESGETTSDTNVRRRRWLLVDLDPVRPAGISATDAEREAARQRARDVHGYLRGEGWPDPIAGDSGNGNHLLYPLDLPRDDGGRVQRILEALAARFDDDVVTVDTTTFNPSRITKVFGTRAGKGDHTPARPHRLARLLHVPEYLK